MIEKFSWLHRAFRCSDDEYVERCRKSIMMMQRWKWWFLGALAAVCVLFVLLGARILVMIGQRLANAQGAAASDIVLAFVFGFGVAWMVHKVLQFTEMVLSSRTEKLLVMYYDIALELADRELPDDAAFTEDARV